MQMKLLRVLQDKEFRAIGGLTQRSSNFRIVAATNPISRKRSKRSAFARISTIV